MWLLGSDCSIVRAHPHSSAGAAGQLGLQGSLARGCRAFRASQCQGHMHGRMDGRWLVCLGQQSPSQCPGRAGRSRDPLRAEGRWCDSVVGSEGSCVPERGVLPLLQLLGSALTGLKLGHWEGSAGANKEEEPSLECLPELMSQHELRCFVVKEVSKGFQFLSYFWHSYFS